MLKGFMNMWQKAPDTHPLTWCWGVPVYATTLLVVAHCIGFALAALSGLLGWGSFVMGLVFSTGSILERFTVWQLVTYAFVPLPLSVWFLVEMAMLYFFGLEVEKTLGRRLYLTLYALMILTPSVSLLFAGLFGTSTVLAGGFAVHFGLFVAFTLLAPGLPILLGIPAKWLALCLGVFNSLMLMAYEQWTGLFALWADVGVAWAVMASLGFAWWPAFLSHRGGSSRATSVSAKPRQDEPRKSPEKSLWEKLRSLPKADAAAVSSGQQGQGFSETAGRSHPSNYGKADEDPLLEIDPILEKISSQGLESLTASERRKLELARTRLLQREKR